MSSNYLRGDLGPLNKRVTTHILRIIVIISTNLSFSVVFGHYLLGKTRTKCFTEYGCPVVVRKISIKNVEGKIFMSLMTYIVPCEHRKPYLGRPMVNMS